MALSSVLRARGSQTRVTSGTLAPRPLAKVRALLPEACREPPVRPGPLGQRVLLVRRGRRDLLEPLGLPGQSAQLER